MPATSNGDVKQAAIDGVADNVTSAPTFDAADELLLAWLVWWRENDDAPAKMPDALHVRTTLYLFTQADDERRSRLNAALGVT